MKQIFETIDFEGIAPAGSFGTNISDGYDGFHWSNMGAIQSQDLNSFGENGYASDLHSGSSVGFVDQDSIGTISADRAFRLVDGYFAAGWDIGLTVTVDGFRDGVEVAHKHFIVDDTSSTLFHFGRSFRNLDSVTFTASGGTQDPNTTGEGNQIVIEDLKVRANPFPSTSSVHSDALDHHQVDHAPVSEGFVV